MGKKITGKVVFQKIGTGCWGIIDDSGTEYRPINMPEQLKQVGAKAQVVVEEVEDDFSMFMWGTPVRIVSFNTLAWDS